MNIWRNNYLFEYPNSIDWHGCLYILPGQQFTQVDDFFLTLKEFLIICTKKNYQPSIEAHIQIYQQYEQILLQESKHPNGLCLQKQYFIIRQLTNQQMEMKLLPFQNSCFQKQISQELIWYKLKNLSKRLFSQFQQSNNIIQNILNNIKTSIKNREQSSETLITINNYDFRSIVSQKTIIFTTDLEQYDITGLSMIFRLLTLKETLKQGIIIEIIDKYKQIRDEFKLIFSHQMNIIITKIQDQFVFKDQDHYLSIDYQQRYRFQQATIYTMQDILRCKKNQFDIDLIIKKNVQDYARYQTVQFIEKQLDYLSKQLEQ